MSDPTPLSNEHRAELRRVAEAAHVVPEQEHHQSGHWERFRDITEPWLVLALLDDRDNWESRAAERDAECDRRFKAQHAAEARATSAEAERDALKAERTRLLANGLIQAVKAETQRDELAKALEEMERRVHDLAVLTETAGLTASAVFQAYRDVQALRRASEALARATGGGE